MTLSPTQISYLAKIEAEGGPVPAAEAFTRLRMSKLSVGRMIEAGALSKEQIDGRSHYRLTKAGIAALAAQH
jgi:hypothetical protein